MLDAEDVASQLGEQMKYSELGSELLKVMGIDKAPEEVPVNTLVQNIAELQDVQSKNGTAGEEGGGVQCLLGEVCADV